MDIIKPNSSYPSIHDGLHMLTGSYVSQTTGGSDRITTTLIKTGMRNITYAHLYSLRKLQDRDVTIPVYTSQYRLLGYLEETDTQNFTKNLNVVVPNGEIMNYLIIGSDQIPNIPTHEIVGSTGTTETDKKLLKVFLNADGTATRFESNIKQTITGVKYADGIYKISSNVSFFKENKTFVQFGMDGASFSNLSWSFSGAYFSTTEYRIYVLSNNETDIALTDLQDRLCISFEVYP